jgi:hypothetical protein
VDVKVAIEQEYWWVPEWNKNKLQANPVRFRKRLLTGGNRLKLIAFQDGQPHIESEQVFLATVLEVENLTANGKAVATARDVLRHGELYLLAVESVADSLMHTEETGIKNSSLPSAG